jgi:hypothetical protein
MSRRPSLLQMKIAVFEIPAGEHFFGCFIGSSSMSARRGWPAPTVGSSNNPTR